MRSAKPWYRESEDRWYITLHGKKRSLGVKGKKNKKQAHEAWHRLSLEPEVIKPILEPIKPLTVGKLISDYLKEAGERLKANSFAILQGRLRPFSKAMGKVSPEALSVKLVEGYMKGKAWSMSTKNGFVAALKASFNWAVEEGILKANPIAKLEKPSCESRGAKAIIPLEVHLKLLQRASKPLKNLLELLWETGARPSELASLKIGEVDYEQSIAIIREHKTEHHGKKRILFFTDKALTILKEASGERDSGLILRTLQANAWHKNAICEALRQLCLKVGVKATAYGYRHSYATRA